MINNEVERRGSRSRALERSLSYSEAIGNGTDGRSSIEIPRIADTEVYTNEELKKQFRISQTYVEGKEIAFPYVITNFDKNNKGIQLEEYSSQYSSEDERPDDGLVMTIDVETESPKSSDKNNVSDTSTQPLVYSNVSSNDYETIEVAESFNNGDSLTQSTHGYSHTYTKRRKKGKKTRQQHGRPIRSRRVVYKSGEENVPVRSHIPAKSIKYMRDIVNTVINSKWRFIILLMICAHFIFWLFFAAIWYAVSTSYQDDIGDGKEHCVTGTSSFAGLLMMSVETQMTIGYGVRFPNEECPEGIIVMVLEIIAGTALSGGLSSLLFTKLVRPNRHVSSVGFSTKATIHFLEHFVPRGLSYLSFRYYFTQLILLCRGPFYYNIVCLRDGKLCLQFRVWDLLNLHIIGSTITAYMLRQIKTLEGELVPNYIHQIKLKEARAFLLWPITVVHVIDQESPLYNLSAQDMLDYRFEIVVCLTGSSKNMGTVTQSRTSYLSKEIIWGYRFKNVLEYCKKEEAYIIDTDGLNTVEQVETPLCSASRLKEYEEDMKSEKLLSTPTNMSLSPTNISLNQEDSTLSRIDESLASSAGTAGTKISSWHFRRYPEYMPDQKLHTLTSAKAIVL